MPSIRLEGDYWMEHGTHGRIATTGYTAVLYDSFADARDGPTCDLEARHGHPVAEPDPADPRETLRIGPNAAIRGWIRS